MPRAEAPIASLLLAACHDAEKAIDRGNADMVRVHVADARALVSEIATLESKYEIAMAQVERLAAINEEAAPHLLRLSVIDGARGAG